MARINESQELTLAIIESMITMEAMLETSPTSIHQQVQQALMQLHGGNGFVMDYGQSCLLREDWIRLRRMYARVSLQYYNNIEHGLSPSQTVERDRSYQLICSEEFGAGDHGLTDSRDINLEILVQWMYNNASPIGPQLELEQQHTLWNECSTIPYFEGTHNMEGPRLLLAAIERKAVTNFLGHFGSIMLPDYRTNIRAYTLSGEYMSLLEQEEIARDTLRIVSEP